VLVGWLKVKALISNPSTGKKKKKKQTQNKNRCNVFSAQNLGHVSKSRVK
jgi:hypothetical protein